MSVSEQQAREDIADVLYLDPAELEERVGLDELGMDSVRIMEIVERWRRAGVSKIDFIELASDKRLSHWLSVLRELQTPPAE